MDELKKDLAGIGKRLNQFEIEQTKHAERIETNKENINDLWKNMTEFRSELKSITAAIAAGNIETGNKINRGIIWVIAIVALPTALILYKLIGETAAGG